MLTSLETTDIFRGAFIICMGGTLESIRFEEVRTNIGTFIFTGEDLPKHDSDYTSGRALVNPLQFREALNTLRDILFNKLRNTNNPTSSRLRRTPSFVKTTSNKRNMRYDRTRDYRGPQTRY